MGKKKDFPSIGETIFGEPFKRRPLKRGRNPFDIKPIEQRPKLPKRDSRRAFAYTQKVEIYRRQNGNCAMCGRKLDFTLADFDHIKPFESGGKTTVANGEALHKECHAKKTQKQILKKVDRKRKPKRDSPFSIL
jgi:5-methylcytosine-specific restriction endonuclease McrA